MALCDWSNLQQRRRNLARKHCSPREFSSHHQKVSDAACLAMQECMDRLQEKLIPGKAYHLKPLLMQTCSNMFSQYMCTTRFDYDDTSFLKVVKCFDEIFWEINQGYAVDFLPWLSPFYTKHMHKLSSWSEEIRVFIMERIINVRDSFVDEDSEETGKEKKLKSYFIIICFDKSNCIIIKMRANHLLFRGLALTIIN